MIPVFIRRITGALPDDRRSLIEPALVATLAVALAILTGVEIALLASGGSPPAGDVVCKAVPSATERLACYDAHPKRTAEVSFKTTIPSSLYRSP